MNVVAVTPDRDNYINPISKYLDYPLVFLRFYNWNKLKELNPVLVIFIGDWQFEHFELVRQCNKNNIPTILMMDGTIEWKHFFENPKWSFGGNESPYIPSYCDKIFVPGHSTYRFLEFFANNGKCEIVGLPRLDSYASLISKSILNNERNLVKYVGVLSGNTPGYTKEQIDNSIALFNDLNSYSKTLDNVKFIFRLRKGFVSLVDNDITIDNSANLIDFLDKVDVVISQPSTAVYESMLLNIPTAIAEYSNTPNYMQAAFNIHHKLQIKEVIEELFNPTPMKLLLQKQILSDTISFVGESAKIAGDVINEIIKQSNSKIKIPENIFTQFLNETSKNKIKTNLFSNRQYFEVDDLNLLKEELVKLQVLNKKLNYQLNRLKFSYWFNHVINKFFKWKKD